MRKIIHILFIFWCSGLIGQDLQPGFNSLQLDKKKKQDKFLTYPLVTPTTIILDFSRNFSDNFPNANLQSTLTNGTKIYSLPGDNMICLVPDLTQFYMPNVARKVKIFRRPQDYFPRYKIIPDGN